MAEEENKDKVQESPQEPQEEIIVEEAEGAEQDEALKQQEIDDEAKKKKKRFFLISGVLGGVIFVLIIVLLTVIFSKDESEIEPLQTEPIVESLKEDKTRLQSRLEDMISKANVLYEEGRKHEALKLYEHIANFSKSISYYNLGVSQMKQKQYEDALNSFDQAIQNQEHRTISALNAAVSALELNDKKLFEYYIDLAYAYLSYESSSPLYKFLYAAINFYKNNSFEILSTHGVKPSEYYTQEFYKLGAYAYLKYGDFFKAIEAFEKANDKKDEFVLGLSYANIAEYEIAAKHLSNAVEDARHPKRAPLALALVQLQNRNYKDAADKIDMLREEIGDEAIAQIYPIKVKLHDALYDANEFQKGFIAKYRNNKKFSYRLLFNYAPYKVFDAGETIKYIQKGSGTIFIDEVSSNTTTYLSRSGVISEVNSKLSEAIRLALDQKITQANTMFKELLSEYDSHSIVHYNLGLTYAQMGNFIKANEHFTRSYHLDASNFLAGIFAVMSAELIKKDAEKLQSILVEDLRHEAKNEKTLLYETLLQFMGANISAMISWSESDPQKNPFNTAVQVVTYLNHDNQSELIKYTNRLQKITDNDLMSQLLHQYAKNYKLPVKQFASNLQAYLLNNIMPVKQIYFGAKLPTDTYIEYVRMAGELFSLKEQLKDDLLFASDPRGIMLALSEVLILLQEYEYAYTLMNELIDKYKMKDSHTLFLGAVASIAAGHNANAVVLLRLASMEDANNFESRYGLGLLYQERNNLEGASIQYNLIEGKGLVPKYFDFEITDQNIARSGA
jgi:tetratricopeptide (TPR) repeat protein